MRISDWSSDVCSSDLISDLEAAIRKAEPKGTVIMQITGDTPPKERQALRERFGGDENVRIVLIAQMRTMRLAVNELVSASHAVYASLSEARDDWVPSRDRLPPTGQDGSRACRPVHVPGPGGQGHPQATP